MSKKDFFTEADCDYRIDWNFDAGKQKVRAITLETANRLIAERSTVVYQYRGSLRADWSHVIDEDFGGIRKYANRALLICVEEIEKEDTAEGLLQDLVNWKEWDGMSVSEAKASKPTLYDIQSRARKLLEGK